MLLVALKSVPVLAARFASPSLSRSMTLCNLICVTGANGQKN